MMAGYSGTPLAKKLGIGPGSRVLLVGAPVGFEDELAPLPPEVQLTRRAAGKALFDVVLFFAPSARDLQQRFATLAGRLEQNGGLWIAWPKKSSGVATDLADGVVRVTGLAGGLVDNKVCAVNAVWSGLRFVIRVADRKPIAKATRKKA